MALMMTCRIVDADTGATVIEHCLLADGIWSRFWGLMGKARLPDGQAMLIEPSSSIHTMFMRFTIDVVYLDRDGRVVKIATVPPFRASAARGARSVLEMAGGSASASGIHVGQRLWIERPES